MGKPEEPPPLIMVTPEGAMFGRRAMEEQVREKLSTVHDKRLKAIEMGLPTKVAYDMEAITVIHWILDQMISKGEIQGDLIGVSSDLGADHDPDTKAQFTQRLAMFIENGQAVKPLEGEGIDMNKLPVPPPPGMVPPNGQVPGAPAFSPQQPPQMPQVPGVPGVPGAPQAMAAPGMPQVPQVPQAPQPPGFPPQAPTTQPMPPAAPPPMAPPSAAPPMPPGMPAPQISAPPPPSPAPMAPQAPQAPMAPQPPAPAPIPPQAMPPQAPAPAVVPQTVGGQPAKANPNRPWGKPSDGKKRRTKAEIMEDEAYDVWMAHQGQAVLQQNQAAAAATVAPQAQLPPGFPAPPAAPMPPAAAQPTFSPAMVAPAAPGVDLEPLQAQVNALARQVAMVDAALSLILRAQYQRQGEPSCESILTELGVPLPR